MIFLKQVILRRGSKILLDGASITINPGEKVGLVGRNGAGKYSLFALLNRSLHEDGGEFSIPTQWRMSEVAQNMPETEESATTYVIAGDTALLAAQEEVDAAQMTDDGDRIANAYMHLSDCGAYDATARAQALILGLGFKISELEQPVNSFSGGWRMRLQLARALMCPSELLLLDEPMAGMSVENIPALVEIIRSLATVHKKTVLIVEHHMEVILGLADRIAVLNYGELLTIDTPQNVMDNPTVQSAYLGAEL